MTADRGPWDYWNSALNGSPIDVIPGKAEAGYYRMNDRRLGRIGLHVWRMSNGQLACRIGKAPPEVVIDEPTFVERIFGWAAKYPVEEENYQFWLESQTGQWLDDPKDVDEAVQSRVGENAPPEVVVAETITELLHELNRWLSGIGGKVETQEHADTAANYASRFSELQKEAVTKHKAEKEPHLQAGRNTDAKWKPIQTSAADAVAYAKRLTTEYLAAEKARRLRDAAEKLEKGKQVNPQDLKVKAGTRGRSTALRTRRVGIVVDAPAFAAWLVEKQNADMMALLQRLAQGIASAAGEAPGMTTKDEQVAA
jgi:hypothetical protein